MIPFGIWALWDYFETTRDTQARDAVIGLGDWFVHYAYTPGKGVPYEWWTEKEEFNKLYGRPGCISWVLYGVPKCYQLTGRAKYRTM